MLGIEHRRDEQLPGDGDTRQYGRRRSPSIVDAERRRGRLDCLFAARASILPDVPHANRHLRRQLRPDHARPRRSHRAAAWSSSTGSIVAVATNSSKQPLFTLDERVALIRAARRRRAARRGAAASAACSSISRASVGAQPAHPRPARRERLRVRVSDGAHEPPPLAAARDGVHGAVARHDVHQREPRARGRALRRRRRRPRASARRRGAAREDRARSELSSTTSGARAAASRDASCFPRATTRARWTRGRALARRRDRRAVVVLDPAAPRDARRVRALGVESAIRPTDLADRRRRRAARSSRGARRG